MEDIRIESLECNLCCSHCTMIIERGLDGNGIQNVYGCRCSMGYEYITKYSAKQQCMLPTSVRVNSKDSNRLPVNTDAPLPEIIVPKVMMFIRTVEVNPPVMSGEIIVENVLGTGVNIISTKSINF